MTFRRLLAALVFGLACVSAAGAEEVPLIPEVGPDQIRELAARLQQMGGKPNLKDFDKLPPGMREKLLEMYRNNPRMSPEQLAEQYKQSMTPEQRAEFERRFRGQGNPFAGANPPSVPPARPPARIDLPDNGLDHPPPNDPMGEPLPPRPLPKGGFQPNLDDLPMPHDGALPDFPPDGRPWQQPNWNLSPEEMAQRQRQFEAFARAWEKNIGPLQQTPEIQKTLYQLFTSQSAGRGGDGARLDDLLNGTSGQDFARITDTSGAEGNWNLPDLGLGDWRPNWGGVGDSFSAPTTPSGGQFSQFDMGSPAAGGSWLSVILLGVFAAVAIVLWFLWPMLTGKTDDAPVPLPGLGPWPVDPRTIRDREALIKAFEYLSVKTCGGAAKVWNHLTIAEGLRATVPTAGELAEPLARLYAVARYTPADEPLPPNAIPDARRHLCTLAGVSPA